jgi:hypothetical protein
MTHDALLVVLPIFISIRAIPPAGVVMPLVGETYSNSVVPKGPKLLDQPIVKLVVPFPFEKSDDCISPIHELSSIRQRLSTVYARATCFGLREFQPSSALRTLAIAVSKVNGGTSGVSIGISFTSFLKSISVLLLFSTLAAPPLLSSLRVRPVGGIAVFRRR